MFEIFFGKDEVIFSYHILSGSFETASTRFFATTTSFAFKGELEVFSFFQHAFHQFARVQQAGSVFFRRFGTSSPPLPSRPNVSRNRFFLCVSIRILPLPPPLHSNASRRCFASFFQHALHYLLGVSTCLLPLPSPSHSNASRRCFAFFFQYAPHHHFLNASLSTHLLPLRPSSHSNASRGFF